MKKLFVFDIEKDIRFVFEFYFLYLYMIIIQPVIPIHRKGSLLRTKGSSDLVTLHSCSVSPASDQLHLFLKSTVDSQVFEQWGRLISAILTRARKPLQMLHRRISLSLLHCLSDNHLLLLHPGQINND